MATLKSISAELEVIDEKKAKLRKAFEDLQAHSSLLSSSSSSSCFTNLKWDDLDSHFTSLQSNLHHKFALLKSLKSDSAKAQSQPPKSKGKQKVSSVLLDPVLARPELKSFCEKMDGFGLRNYLLDRPGERATIRVELADAWKQALRRWSLMPYRGSPEMGPVRVPAGVRILVG